MRIYLIIIFFPLFINNAYAQSAVADSFRKLLLRAQTDTQRINLSNKLANALGEINIDSSSVLVKNIIEDSKKNNYKQGEADALRTLATNYSRQGDYIAAVKNLKESEEISTSLDDSLRIAKVYSTYGMIYGMQGKYDTSIDYYERSIGIDERFNDINSLSSGYGNLAIGYQMQSNFSQALFYQLKSLKIAEQRHDINSQAYTQMNLGNTYQNIGDTLRSEKALLKGIELAKSVGIKNVELYGYSNIATLYSILKRWNESYNYATKSADLAKIMGDAGIQSASISKAALALANMKEYAEAESLNKNAMAIADSSKQPFNIFQTYSTMGSIFLLQERYTDAIPFFEKSIQLSSSMERYDNDVRQVYSELSTCYEKTDNYSKALANFKSSTEISDSIRSKENIRKATELTLKDEFEKKQTISDAIQGKRNAEAKLSQILLLSGLIITLIIAGGAWIAFRNKQKANQLLQKQKEELQSALTQLKATQSQLVQSEKMASLGELTAGIAHEIQNPLNFVKNFSEVSTELVDEVCDEIESGNKENASTIGKDLKNNLEKITHHTMRADSIVKGMLQHSRNNSGEKEPADINALADEYLRLGYHGLRAKDKSFNATLHTDFDETIGKVNIIPQDIGRVILNLFINAFYSVSKKQKMNIEGYEPTVFVSTKKLANEIQIRVKDNGMGISSKVVGKIFQPFFTTKPTGEGTGLGLSLSYDIITKGHSGEMEIETKEGEFAEFIIHLPL